MELTLLGTGTPNPSPQRAGPSNHLRIGGESVLVDTGTGCVRRMVEMGEDTTDLDYIFITHMHSDHTIDLAHVLLTGWIRYREAPIHHRRPGTDEGLRRAARPRLRGGHPHTPPP